VGEVTGKKLMATFEYCVTQDNCSYCPMSGNCPTNYELQKQALDLINRQQTEIERLQSKVNRLKQYDEERDIRLHARLIATAKSEAYKEFSERLLRKATFMRDEETINGVVKVGDIYEALEEMECE
jgi:hypothetical protein